MRRSFSSRLVVGVPVWLVSAAGSPFAHLAPGGPVRASIPGHPDEVPVVAHWLARVALLMAWVFWAWMTTCIALELHSWVLGRSATRLPASRTLQSVVACLVGTALALSVIGRETPHVPEARAASEGAIPSTRSALRVVGDRDPIGTRFFIGPDGRVIPADPTGPAARLHRDADVSLDGSGALGTLDIPAIEACGGSAAAPDPIPPRVVPVLQESPTHLVPTHRAVAPMSAALQSAQPSDPGTDGPRAAPLGAMHVVGHRETLWSIAEQRLGSARRWREIAELNYGIRQDDGSQLTVDHWVRSGWILALPTSGSRPPAPEKRGPGSGILHEEAPYPPFGAGIVGVGIADLVDRLRRVQQRHRPSGASMPLPDPMLRRIEGRIRSGDGRDLLRSVDAGVRLYLRSVAGRTGPAPRIIGITISDRELRLVLDADELPVDVPDEFTLEPEGPALRIDRAVADAHDVRGRGGRSRVSPLPTLVSVGRSQDEVVLAHLEGMGSVVVTGHPEACDGIARVLALELATSRWSAGFDLVLVGFGAELGRFARVSSVADPESVAQELARRRMSGSVLLDRNRESSFVEARARDRAGPWDPVVVLCGPKVPPDSASELLSRSGDGRTGMAVVAFCEGVEACHRLQVDADAGSPSLGVFGTVVTPQRVSGVELTEVVALLDASERLEVVGSTVTRLQADESETGVGVGRAGDAASAYASVSAVSSDVVVSVRPAAHNGAVGRPARMSAVEPEVEVAVLGPVEIHGAAREFTRAWAKELVVYLAMHPQGASNDAWATALWPDQVMAPSSLHSTASVARRALGTSRDGSDHLPRSHGRLALASTVGTDWDRFVVLAESAEPVAWRSALEIVRGRPFEGLRSSDWSILDGIAPAIESAVVDLSGRLAGASLRTGDARGAEWAARRGLLVSPYDERLYRMLMRAADLAGNPRGVETVMAELVRVVADEIEPVESVHPSTWELYRSLSRRPPTSRSIDRLAVRSVDRPEVLQRQLGDGLECLDVARDEQGGGDRLAPTLDVVPDLLLGADEGGVLDELGRDGPGRLVLASFEIELLDLGGLGLVAHPGEDVEVEVHRLGTHAPDVERQYRAHACRRRPRCRRTAGSRRRR